MATIKKFKVGKVYQMRSVCDHDCVWMYKVISRTECTVVLRQMKDGKPYGDEARMRIKKQMTEHRGAESVMPLGTYSMAPILSADNCQTIKR